MSPPTQTPSNLCYWPIDVLAKTIALAISQSIDELSLGVAPEPIHLFFLRLTFFGQQARLAQGQGVLFPCGSQISRITENLYSMQAMHW